MVGQTISHYKVLEKLGEGGMGAVYKAEDSKLGRTVALKFLLPQALGSEEERQRFKHEARAAASLSHPNICTVHEIDEDQGQTFIAMEFVEGESLKDKIKSGPLKLKETIEIATQIAMGLHEAHQKGIVHRDIKPANIMVAPKGQAKIMDFGIAKSSMRTALTKAGTTLGTVAYMSPEQVRGDAVDGRSDIWSVGAVLYEMVTGQQAFKGGYEQAVLYAILNTEPEPMTALRTGVPMELERITAKALAKDPEYRYQHVEEMPVDLRAIKITSTDISKPTATSIAAPPKPARTSRRRVLAYALGALVAGIIVGATSVLHIAKSLAPAPRPVTRFTVTLPAGQELGRTSPPLALSPDGTHLVYVASNPGGSSLLYTRALDELEATPVPGTEGAGDPFFSPDGLWVGFFADSKLKKVAVSGGAPFTICDAKYVGTGASWGSDDNIIFPPAESSGLVRVPAAGGSLQVLTTPNLDAGEICHRRPCALPDGKSVIFTVLTGEGPHLAALDLKTRKWRTLLQGVTQARYLNTGHLVYAQAGGLRAAKFDTERLEIEGTPVPILDGIYRRTYFGVDVSYFAVSPTGNLAYVPGDILPGANTLVWVNREGEITPLTDGHGIFRNPRVSPDGRKIAVTDFAELGGSRDIWIYDVERGTRTRLTSEGNNTLAVWTPDGKRLVFASNRSGPMSLYCKPADGSGEAQQLLPHEYSQFPESWSPDGRTLAFTQLNPETGGDIYTLAVRCDSAAAGDSSSAASGIVISDTSAVSPFIVTPFYERSPCFSPDGKWVAYASDESGRFEIYARPYPGPGPVWAISTEGGRAPAWSPQGNELFYISGDHMLSVAIETEPEFKAGQAETLFVGRFDISPAEAQSYDVTPDGQRFIMVKGADEMEPSKLHVVVNWMSVLNKLTSTKKGS